MAWYEGRAIKVIEGEKMEHLHCARRHNFVSGLRDKKKEVVGGEKRKRKRSKSTIEDVRNFPTDKFGWIEAEKYRPREYDLVMLQDERGKRVMGWWSGMGWDWGRSVSMGKVVKWRRTVNRKDVDDKNYGY